MIPIESFSFIIEILPIVPEQLIIKSFGFTVNLFSDSYFSLLIKYLNSLESYIAVYCSYTGIPSYNSSSLFKEDPNGPLI